MTRVSTILLSLWTMLATSAALAAEDGAGKPIPGGHHHQRPVTEVASDIIWLDNFLHVIMAAITIFVIALLAYAMVKFSRKNNPKPATFTHNALVEVIWTAVPVVILIVIAVPSLKLLFLQLDVPEPDITVKVTGNQWYWSYEYPDEDLSFDALMLQRDELDEYGYEPDEYLLATDERMVVPVGAVVHVLVTAGDVIHNWNIPSFGSKIDAIPGRINETWFKAEETGTYFGQCMELCGKDHSFMPIVVEVVDWDEYDTWVLEVAARNAPDAPQFAAAD